MDPAIVFLTVRVCSNSRFPRSVEFASSSSVALLGACTRSLHAHLTVFLSICNLLGGKLAVAQLSTLNLGLLT